MNERLFFSSLLVAIIYLFNLWLFNIELSFTIIVTFFGIITSLLNHGFKSYIFKCLDRITITLIFFIYLYNISLFADKYIQKILVCLLIMSPFLYFISKIPNDKNMCILFHQYGHIQSLIFLSAYNIIC